MAVQRPALLHEAKFHASPGNTRAQSVVNDPGIALLPGCIRFRTVMQEEIDESPLYANVKWVVRPDGVREALEINYLTLYAHNGWYDIGYLGLLKVGAHDGDWEHMTVRLSAATGELQVMIPMRVSQENPAARGPLMERQGMALVRTGIESESQHL